MFRRLARKFSRLENPILDDDVKELIFNKNVFNAGIKLERVSLGTSPMILDFVSADDECSNCHSCGGMTGQGR
jgi:hypothetical protein